MRYIILMIAIVIQLNNCWGYDNTSEFTPPVNRFFFGFNRVSTLQPLQNLIYKVGVSHTINSWLSFGGDFGAALFPSNEDRLYCDAFTGCGGQLDELYRISIFADVKMNRFHLVTGFGYDYQKGVVPNSDIPNRVSNNLNYDARFIDVRISGEFEVPLSKKWELRLTPAALKFPILFTSIHHDGGSRGNQDVKNGFGALVPLQLIFNAAICRKF